MKKEIDDGDEECDENNARFAVVVVVVGVEDIKFNGDDKTVSCSIGSSNPRRSARSSVSDGLDAAEFLLIAIPTVM